MTNTSGYTQSGGNATMSYRYLYDNGNIWGPSSYEESMNLTLNWAKESVDTGRFTPNVYRVNPYHVEKAVVDSPSCAINVQERYGGTVTVDVNVGGCPYQRALASKHGLYHNDYPSKGRAAKQALIKAYGNLDPAVAGFGEDLGEIRETFNTLVHPFKNLRDFCDAHQLKKVRQALSRYAKTGKYKALVGKKAAEAAADAWMEVRYGLRPIYYSIQNLLEVLADMGLKYDPYRIRTARGSAKFTLGGKIHKNLGLLESVGIAAFYGNVKHEVKEKGYAQIHYNYLGLGNLLLSEKMGLTPRHFPETVWALTSRSFVFDWFWDVGSYLEACRFIHPDVKILGNCVGVRTSNKVSMSDPYFQLPFGNAKNHKCPTGNNYATETYTRVTGQDLAWTPTWIGGQRLDLLKSIDLAIVAYNEVKKVF